MDNSNMLYKTESLKDLEKRGRKLFDSYFISPSCIAAFAPGRVNLIGEHTDYNSGFVLPMALPMVTMIIGGPCDGDVSRVVTDNQGVEKPIFEYDKKSADRFVAGKLHWANYLIGVLALHPRRDEIPSFNAVIVSSLPVGSGLSSSAAFEISFFRGIKPIVFFHKHKGLFTNEAFENRTFIIKFIDKLVGVERTNINELKEMALLCQNVEHTFAKVPCGIMDQLVCSMASQKQAVLIDCKSLEITKMTPVSDDVTLLIINSNVKHDLSSSEYPVRRKQCEQACEALSVESLRDATLDELNEKKDSMDNLLFRRARHVITENDRCIMSAKFLQIGNFEEMGKLMKLSHQSLRDDYEVSCKELDSLVEIMNRTKGVYGSRMTGGGFGGCTVTLLKKGFVDDAIENVKKQYAGVASFYKCELNSMHNQ